MIWTEPMQTLVMLDSIKTNELSYEDYCYYQFIREHANYRLQRTLSPDILPALIEFFQSQGNELYAGRVNYLLGSELEWIHKPYEALLPLMDAERNLSDCGCSDLYMGMTYFRLGRVYEEESLYDIAHNFYLKALPVFQNHQHTFYLACTFRDLARTMSENTEEERQQQKDYFIKALSYAGMMNDSTLYYTILCDSQDRLYDEVGIYSYEIAVQLCNLSYHPYAMQLFEHYFPKQLDSAKYYLDIYAVDTLRMEYSKNNYYYFLSQYLYACGQKDSAFHLLDRRYQVYHQDAIDHGHQRMYAIARQYDVAREREEALNQKLQKRRNTLWMSLGLLVLSVVLSLSLWHLDKLRQRQISHARELKQLRHELQIRQEALMRKLQSQVALSRRLNELRMGKRENSEEYARIIDQFIYDNSFTAEHFDKFREEFDTCFPHLMEKLAHEYPLLSANELKLIALFVTGLDVQDICILLHIANRTLYNNRNRIKQHLGLSENDDLDEWIRKTAN